MEHKLLLIEQTILELLMLREQSIWELVSHLEIEISIIRKLLDGLEQMQLLQTSPKRPQTYMVTEQGRRWIRTIRSIHGRQELKREVLGEIAQETSANATIRLLRLWMSPEERNAYDLLKRKFENLMREILKEQPARQRQSHLSDQLLIIWGECAYRSVVLAGFEQKQ